MGSSSATQATPENTRLNFSKLDFKAGDIIATSAPTFTSKAIRNITHGQVSHAILCTGVRLGYMYAVDDTEEGVVADQL